MEALLWLIKRVYFLTHPVVDVSDFLSLSTVLVIREFQCDNFNGGGGGGWGVPEIIFQPNGQKDFKIKIFSPVKMAV